MTPPPREPDPRFGLAIPDDRAFDSTRAFLRDGYDFIGNRCRALGSDAFRTRILLRPVIGMMGEDAARRFYDGKSFTRVGATPPLSPRLLQGRGNVQTLDGAPHAHRKRLFLDIAHEGAAERIADLFEQHWLEALPQWRAAGRIVFHDRMTALLTDVACAWAGAVPTARERRGLVAALAGTIDGAGLIGPRGWRAALLRRRAEGWARARIDTARAAPGAKSPLTAIASYGDEAGTQLPSATAAVELLNLLRPIAAVARFITFAALALHEHPDAAQWLAKDVERRALPFSQEVRRFYPFVPTVGGRVKAPFVWRNHAFAAGEWVLLGLHATNHDERLWPQPRRFRPHRFIGWMSHGFDLIPQGAGDARRDHRCPGEAITIALIRRALALLISETDLEVPPQDLTIPVDRFPTLPGSGLVLTIR